MAIKTYLFLAVILFRHTLAKKRAYFLAKVQRKADRAALWLSCGVCFEALACVFASADACKEDIYGEALLIE